MKYKYHSFTSNRSAEDAEKIFAQRIEDATYIYKKHHKSFDKRSCPVCGGEDSTREDDFHGMYGIDLCGTCSSLFVNPAPSIDALSDYYENCLCNRQLSSVIKKRYDNNDLINDDRVQLLLDVMQGIFEQSTPGKVVKILEVGCNNGAFLSKLKQALEKNYAPDTFELHGVDIDSTAVGSPVDDSLKLFHGFAEDISHEHKDTYDIVLHFELVEHLIDPRGFVSSIHEMLLQNGTMVFTTPNILGLDNQALSYNGMRYLAHGMFPPMHINAFSTENIGHFLISTGFSVEEIATPGKFDVDMLMQCSGDLKESLFQDVTNMEEGNRALLQALLARLNVSSHMQCVARKK